MNRLFRELKINLAIFRRKIPNAFWVIPLLTCCVMLPIAIKIDILMPNALDIINKFLELLFVSPKQAFLFAYVMVSIGAFPTIIIGGIFLFIRASFGYETRKVNSLKSWALMHLYTEYRVILGPRLAKWIKPS